MMQDGESKQVAAQFKCTCANPAAACQDDQNWRYKLCNGTRQYLFTRCRYPAFTDDYIKRHIDKPDTSPEELRAYMENSSMIRRNKALIIVCIYLTYCVKNLFVPFKTLRMFNYDDLESNINSSNLGASTATTAESNEIVKLVACLATNCSHFSPSSNDETQLEGVTNRLARDISKLPMFKLCHPKINSWYSPVTALDSLGVLIMLCVSFNAFLLGSWITIQQLIFPARNEMIMFIVAPAVTARVVWRRTRELLASVSASYAHFCLNSKLRFFTQTEHEYLSFSARLAGLDPTWSPIKQRRPHQKTTSLPETCKQANAQVHALKPLRSDEELDCMTSECLPIIRTCWWRKTITNIFLCILVVTVSEILTLTGFAFKYIKKKLKAKEEQLASYASEMRRQNCQLWYAGEQEATFGADPVQRQLIDMSRLELKWTTFNHFEGGMFNVMPALGVSMMFAYYWAVIGELEIWLAELRTFLVATLVVSRVKLSQAGGCVEQQPRPLPGHSVFLLRAAISPLAAAQTPMRPRVFTKANTGSRGSGSTRSTISSSFSECTSHTTRIKTKHFYNMTSLRQQFQQEIGSIAMAYFTLIKHCHIRPEDGAVVHASQSTAHDSNEKLVFKMREIKFMELIDKQLQEHLEARRVRYSNRLALQNRIANNSTSSLELNDQSTDPIEVDETVEDDDDDLAHDLYTMEQVYVNFRLFVEHVHGLAPSMGVVLAITYLLNYGLVCISVMCSRKFSDLKTETMFVVVFGWLISNILIVLAANFHANAKKLQPLMWSIIAQLTFSQDNRVKHLRFLWLKQAQILDNQGGLALDAFGLRVTYVNIIQIIIWTVTIIVMALKS